MRFLISKWICLYFYPRPPGGGRLGYDGRVGMYVEISIHALRVEGDATPKVRIIGFTKFLSTPSGWRATYC